MGPGGTGGGAGHCPGSGGLAWRDGRPGECGAGRTGGGEDRSGDERDGTGGSAPGISGGSGGRAVPADTGFGGLEQLLLPVRPDLPGGLYAHLYRGGRPQGEHRLPLLGLCRQLRQLGRGEGHHVPDLCGAGGGQPLRRHRAGPSPHGEGLGLRRGGLHRLPR